MAGRDWVWEWFEKLRKRKQEELTKNPDQFEDFPPPTVRDLKASGFIQKEFGWMRRRKYGVEILYGDPTKRKRRKKEK